MAGEKDRQGEDVSPEQWLAELTRQRHEVLDNNPRHEELTRQKIRLKGNGAEMEWGVAQSVVQVLRGLQENDPGGFAALVALVRPRGATRLPGKVSPRALAAGGATAEAVLRDDGSVEPDYALVLDASYEELPRKGGAVLLDPVAYPSREWVEEWAPVDRKVEIERARITVERAKEAVRKKRGNREGPAR